MLDGFSNDRLGDFIEYYSVIVIQRQIKAVGNVPGNGLSLTVRVCCQINTVSLLYLLFQIFNNVLLVRTVNVSWFEVIVYVNAKSAFAAGCQISDVSL